MSEKLSPGPAVDCDNCGVQPVNAVEAATETCPVCLEFAPAVTLTACPEPDPGECRADTHDFGMDLHVAEA